MKLIRYSNDGFRPQYQSRMKSYVEYLINFKEENLPSNFTDYARNLCITQVESDRTRINHNFDFNGVHVFFAPVERSQVNFFLNHLKAKPQRHELEIDDDHLGYELDSPYLQAPKTLKVLRDTGHVGAFINLQTNFADASTIV